LLLTFFLDWNNDSIYQMTENENSVKNGNSLRKIMIIEDVDVFLSRKWWNDDGVKRYQKMNEIRLIFHLKMMPHYVLEILRSKDYPIN